MARSRKKSSLAAPLAIEESEIRGLWQQVGLARIERADPMLNSQLAEVFNHYRASPSNPQDEKFMVEVRRAHKVLLAWCDGAYYEENGQIWRGAHIEELVQSLHAVSPQINAPSLPRLKKPEWFIAAILIWNIVRGILEVHGQPGGKSSNSKAIRFTSLALIRMGYIHATPNAVSITIKKVQMHTAP